MGGLRRHCAGAGLISVLLLASLPLLAAHGYLSQPISRNYYEYTQSRFWNRGCPRSCCSSLLACPASLETVA